MSNSLQNFLARATQRAANDLSEAFLRLPEDKRNWVPEGQARTAIDQVAEVAILNGSTAELIQSRKWDDKAGMDEFFKAKAALVDAGWDKVKSTLDVNTPRAVAAIQALPESDLGVEVQMPWGPMTLEQIISYPYWNACYHEGQINYIASMLGCLE
jgi:hypothetical protein